MAPPSDKECTARFGGTTAPACCHQVVQACTSTNAKEQCTNSLALMDNELATLCHLQDINDFDNSELECNLGALVEAIEAIRRRKIRADSLH